MNEENRIGRLCFDSLGWLEEKREKGDVVNILVIIIGNELQKQFCLNVLHLTAPDKSISFFI